MQIGAIGAGSSAVFQAWADQLAASNPGARALGELASASGATPSSSLLAALGQGSGDAPSTSVTLSDAALSLAASDPSGGDPTLQQLSQALMLALVLALLDPKGGSA